MIDDIVQESDEDSNGGNGRGKMWYQITEEKLKTTVECYITQATKSQMYNEPLNVHVSELDTTQVSSWTSAFFNLD